MGPMVIALNPEVRTGETLRRDIERYVASWVQVRGSDDQTVEVEISRADIQRLSTFMQHAPLIGLITIGDQRDFRFQVAVRFRVSSQGKLIQTFEYAKAKTIPGDAMTTAQVIKSYQMVMGELRTDLAEALDREFLPLLGKPQSIASPLAAGDRQSQKP